MEMNQPGLGALAKFPSELRTLVYEEVLDGDGAMEVEIDENGVAARVPQEKLALTGASRQLQAETHAQPQGETREMARETSVLILKPRMSQMRFGVKTLEGPCFDLDTWLDDIRRYRLINPRQVVLCVGEIDADSLSGRKVNLSGVEDSESELARIAGRIPLSGLVRTDIAFALDLLVTVRPAKPFHLRLPLRDSDCEEHGRVGFCRLVREAMAPHRTFTAPEWRALPAGALVGQKAWILAKMATVEHIVVQYVGRVYTLLDKSREPERAAAARQAAAAERARQAYVVAFWNGQT